MKADKEFHYFSSAFSGQNSSTFNAVFIMLYFMKIVLATGNAHKKRRRTEQIRQDVDETASAHSLAESCT